MSVRCARRCISECPARWTLSSPKCGPTPMKSRRCAEFKPTGSLSLPCALSLTEIAGTAFCPLLAQIVLSRIRTIHGADALRPCVEAALANALLFARSGLVSPRFYVRAVSCPVGGRRFAKSSAAATQRPGTKLQRCFARQPLLLRFVIRRSLFSQELTSHRAPWLPSRNAIKEATDCIPGSNRRCIPAAGRTVLLLVR